MDGLTGFEFLNDSTSPAHSLCSTEKQITGKENSLCYVRQVCCEVYVHFKTEVIFFRSFLSCRSPVPTATSFLPTQRLQLGRAGPGLSQLPLWCLPAKHSSGVSPGCEVRKRLHGLVFFIHSGRCLARCLGMHTPLPDRPQAGSPAAEGARLNPPSQH